MSAPITISPTLHLGVGMITGADPELFIVNSRGTVVRAKKYVKMCVLHKQVPALNSSNVIWDNITLELQPSAGSCGQHVIDRLGVLMRNMFKVLYNPGAGSVYSLCTTPALPITRKNRVAEVLEFGCSPAMLVVNQEAIEVQPLVDPRNCEYRSIGGHIHMSNTKARAVNIWDAKPVNGVLPKKFAGLNCLRNGEPYSTQQILQNEDERVKLTQMFDIILGTVGCLFEYRMGNQESALIRRLMIGYGRAGEFRVNKQSYEYRTLSPWWMEHPLLAHLVFNLARDVFRLWECDGCADKFLATFNDRGMIEEAINECNPVECEKILVRGIKAFEKVTRQYEIYCGYDNILGSTESSRGEHLIKILAHQPADWFKFLATTTSTNTYRSAAEVVYNSGSGARARPRAEPFSLLRRWNFRSHYWGWKDFALTNNDKGRNKSVRIQPLNGEYITRHWALEAGEAKKVERVA